MAQEMERPRITEVQVRMDCNGCVQKIKKALHSVPGIQDLYIDLSQQKIMIVGRAEPEKIVKALKKTRKSAIICSHMEPEESPVQPAEQSSDEDGTRESKSAAGEPSPPVEPPNDQAQPPQPPADTHRSSEGDIAASQPAESSRPRDVEEVHVIYHYPPDYKYRDNYGQSRSYGHDFLGRTSSNSRGPGLGPEQPYPQYATINYNTYRRPEPPSPQFATHNYNAYTREPSPMQYATHNYNAYRAEPSPPKYSTHDYNAYRAGPPTQHHATHNAYRPEAPPQDYATQNDNIDRPLTPESQTQKDNTRWSKPPPTFSATPNYNTYRPEEPPIMSANLNYNTYRPSPYVTQYEYIRPSPLPQYSHYSRAIPRSEDNYYYGNNTPDGNITSVFSDEDPNSCTIV